MSEIARRGAVTDILAQTILDDYPDTLEATADKIMALDSLDAGRAAPRALLDVVDAARTLVGGLGFWESDGIGRVSWGVDRDGESTPEADADAIALRDALARLDRERAG